MEDFTWADKPGVTAFPIAEPGYPFIFAAAFTTGVFALLGLKPLAILALLTTFAICFFFRDPDRVIPTGQGVVVSPADGKVIKALRMESNPFMEGPCIQVSIFMTVFNVHVNRVSHEGTIENIRYQPGTFVNANLDKAQTHNEHNAVFIRTENQQHICIVQIAGLIARRIICKVGKGDQVKRGQRFGLICFGSRLDVYLPAGTELKVAVGDKVRAGTSILGFLK
jgi:phosphatidylserine decarboxylase